MTAPASCVLGLLGALLTGCHGVPVMVVDGGVDGAPAQGDPYRLVVGPPHTFGVAGERPTGLQWRGSEHLFALTDRAIYLLDLDGRVVNRAPLPVSATGGPAVITSAHGDGIGLGVALSWGGDLSVPAGAYLALSDELGGLSTLQMVKLGPPGSQPRGAWDGQAHQAVWLEPDKEGLALQWAAVSRGGGVQRRLLAAGLSPGENSGDWLPGEGASGVTCAVNAAGQTILRRFSPSGAAPSQQLSPGDEQALGQCRLASSGRSLMAAWIRRTAAASGAETWAGAPDAGLGTLFFDQPVVQLLDPAGEMLGAPQRLSLVEGTVRLESLIWDGHRYLALLDAAGMRGGRLLLTAFDEAGRLLFRDLLLPLDYDPGLLEGARLLAVPHGGYTLLLSIRRPWDEGVCGLVHFELGS